jgi:hypothetical protein
LVEEERGWKVEDGRWKMEDGRWKMEDGRWKMEDGRWKMEEGAESYFCWTSSFLVAETVGYRDMECFTFDVERLFSPRLDLIRRRVFTLHPFISLECITLDYSVARLHSR